MSEHEPQSWGTALTPFVSAKGVVYDEDRVRKHIERRGYKYEPDDLGYQGWYICCDFLCVARFGLGVDDFADQTWRDWYDDRVTPFDAVQQMAENEGLLSFLGEEG